MAPCRHLPSRRAALLGSGALFAWTQLPKLARAEGRDPRRNGKRVGLERFGQEIVGFLILPAQKGRSAVGRLQRGFTLVADCRRVGAVETGEDEEQYSQEPRRSRKFPRARRSTQTDCTRRRRRHRTRTLD